MYVNFNCLLKNNVFAGCMKIIQKVIIHRYPTIYNIDKEKILENITV
jgi:hypothetical protein